MNLKFVPYLALRLGLWVIMGGAVSTLAAESVVPDPPNGFRAEAVGATRLAREQGQQMKVISAAPLPQFYPGDALAARRTGKVVLELLVDAAGNVKDVLVLDESPPTLGFGDAAIAAARTYRFLNPHKKLVIVRIVTQFAP